MNDIEQKALALVNEVARELGWGETKEIFAAGYTRNEALFRAIEQREAAKQELADFKQKVSDAAEVYEEMGCPMAWEGFEQFIIPKPKPDPLVDAAKMMGYFNTAANAWAEDVRAALDALGFEIREKNDD